MKLTQIVEKEETIVGKTKQYGLFSEQYLEKPVVSGDYKMAISPTTCTIKGIPAIDDF